MLPNERCVDSLTELAALSSMLLFIELYSLIQCSAPELSRTASKPRESSPYALALRTVTKLNAGRVIGPDATFPLPEDDQTKRALPTPQAGSQLACIIAWRLPKYFASTAQLLRNPLLSRNRCIP